MLGGLLQQKRKRPVGCRGYTIHSTRIPIKSGIRQGNPLSPSLFSALIGHALAPMFKRWTKKWYGFCLTEGDQKTLIQAVAYADDLTILAQNAHLANMMLIDIQEAMAGLNLSIHPGKCVAICSLYPEGKEHGSISINNTNIPISTSMVTLGHLLAFRTSSIHSFEYRKALAWKVAHANEKLLRSKVVSRKQRIRLLNALVRPCMMHASETWKWSPELLAQVLTAEREFGRWCLRLAAFQPARAPDSDGAQTLEEYITWKMDTAREVAAYSTQAGVERWHKTALKSYWNWAGHIARMSPEGMNNIVACHVHRPCGRGRPAVQWNHILQKFSTHELQGEQSQWISTK